MRTPEGYDSETGAPIASTGGGFDPDAEGEGEGEAIPVRERKPWWWVFGVALVGAGGIIVQWCGP